MHESKINMSKLRVNPSAVLAAADQGPVVILKRNKPVGYVISPVMWEAINKRLDDMDLASIANERLADGLPPVKVSVDEL